MEIKKGTENFFTSTVQSLVDWSRKHSLSQYPFMTACCGLEYYAAQGSHNDISRFGVGVPKVSPTQADLLIVIGTVNHKMAPLVQEAYEKMLSPKWVISFGACASTGGFYQNYAVVQGVDQIIPVDIYIAGCPPRPEALLDGVHQLQELIQSK
ncbi:MAG: NADH-quinone oxidoreductase subunit B [bacterium]|jgi:NADH-quinone oxidoreductase subunit B